MFFPADFSVDSVLLAPGLSVRILALPDGLRAGRTRELVMDTPCVDDSEWFAVQVWAGREQCSVNHLRLHGHHVFLPCYCEHRRWSDRIKKIHRALFAGYVFCRQPAATLAAILKTPGVIRIVGDGRHPLPIPAGEIEADRVGVPLDVLVSGASQVN
jgi:hypothetical protein